MSLTKPENDAVPAEVLDALAHLFANTSDSEQRAAAIHRLVLEIYEVVQWLHEPDVAHDELLSISPLLTEALRHQRRMALGTTTPDHDSVVQRRLGLL